MTSPIIARKIVRFSASCTGVLPVFIDHDTPAFNIMRAKIKAVTSMTPFTANTIGIGISYRISAILASLKTPSLKAKAAPF